MSNGQVVYRAVTARKRYPCDGAYAQRRHMIEPGDVYVRAVMFPGDVNSSGRPWVMRICAAHDNSGTVEQP